MALASNAKTMDLVGAHNCPTDSFAHSAAGMDSGF
jgi:hypothetical protein